jgi:hypothetical protein
MSVTSALAREIPVTAKMMRDRQLERLEVDDGCRSDSAKSCSAPTLTT